MERKKRSKGRGWESCYVKIIYGSFGVEMRAYGQKLVKFCKHTHTHASKLVVEMKKIVSPLISLYSARSHLSYFMPEAASTFP